MFQAMIYGLVGGLSLFGGSFIALNYKFSQKTMARFMAFGSGVLVCALTFGLMEQAFDHGGFDAIVIGFLLGGLTFIVGDFFILKTGGRKHKIRKGLSKEIADSSCSSGMAITMGAFLDGIPESIALGIALFTGQGTGILMLAAIVLSNFPEGISSVPGLLKSGYQKWKILAIWFAVMLLTTSVVLFSFLYLKDLSPNSIGIFEAFAAGAILAMLADTMMPEAYEDGGMSIALLTVFGFLTAFIISRY